jgi:hypothetical protein
MSVVVILCSAINTSICQSIVLLLGSINSFWMQLGGPDKVAEITGRDRRLVKTRSGDVVYQSRKA